MVRLTKKINTNQNTKMKIGVENLLIRRNDEVKIRINGCRIGTFNKRM